MAMTSQLWPASDHTPANGLLADPLIGGVTVHIIPLLLNMDTVFTLTIFVPPVVWLITIPKPGEKRALFCLMKEGSLPSIVA